MSEEHMNSDKASVLLVDDEAGIAESIRYLLERDQFSVNAVATLAEARARLATGGVSLMVLDLGLPDGSGTELLRELRAKGSPLPVIVLTSRNEEVDRVVGLEVGADDYVTKPFSARELVARVKAVLRRGALALVAAAPGGLVIDPERRRVTYAGAELTFTKVEFDLLSALMSACGRVLTREALLDRVWPDATVNDRTIDTHVKGLRQKLRAAGAESEVIETVRGVGYRSRG